MIPVVKGWSTEAAQRTAYLGVQVHGGMGYIEETGAAQYLRDARITTIYEGTTGIQANDLVGRKIGRDGGATLLAAIAQAREPIAALEASGDRNLAAIAGRLRAALDALEGAGRHVAASLRSDVRGVLAGAVPLLELAGIAFGGAQLARAALVASRMLADNRGDADFLHAKIATARHFADHFLTQAPGLRDAVVDGSTAAVALAEAQF
jgi:butyryl-CoA dehydrogenase